MLCLRMLWCAHMDTSQAAGQMGLELRKGIGYADVTYSYIINIMKYLLSTKHK